MANTIKGITIEIEGKTSGLTKSLQEVESQIKKDDAALKNLDKALQLDPKNVDLLAAREAVLADKTDAVAQKMEILQQVHEDATTAMVEGMGLSTSQMAELEAEIATTGVTLDQLSGEADNASGSIEDTGESAESTAGDLDDAGASAEDFGEAVETAGKVAEKALKAVIAAAAAVGTAIVAGTTKASSSLIKATTDTAAFADEINTLSKTTGLSTKTLQELNYAAGLLDVETSTITSSMTKMEKTMSSAVNGSKSAQKGFSALGISIKDSNGQMRSSEDVFWDAIDALGKIENETQRDAMAMQVFGKSAKELNPLIEAGSNAFRDLAKEANDVGYVMSNDTLDGFNALQDNMDRLSNLATSVGHSFGQVLLPILSQMSGAGVGLMSELSKALSEAGGDVDKLGGIIETFAPRAVALVEEYAPKILSVVQSVISALLPAIIAVAPQLISMLGTIIEQVASSISQNAESFISAFSSLFQSVVNSVTTLLPVIIPLAVSLITTIGSALVENAPMLLQSALSVIMTLVESFLSTESIEQLTMAATSIITGLLNGLTTALPILIPAAINAIMTLVETLLSSGCLSQILQAALTLITTLAGALISYLPKLIERLPEIIMGIVKFLTGDALPQIIDAGVKLLTAIVTNLPQIIAAVIKALVTLVVEMGKYILGDGKDALLKSFGDAFGKIISAAANWGADMIQGFIDGIKKMIGKLTSAVSSVAKTIASYLHFSEPDLGPLSDFSESGSDMIQNFIKSMNSQQNALKNAVNQTAAIISNGMDDSYTIATKSSVQQTVDYSGGLSRIEQAITAQAVPAAAAAGPAQIVVPVYIGSEHIDTIVLDAIDKNNYTTGGH